MAGMTSDLSVVRGQWQVASKGAVWCVLREAAWRRQRNERQRNGWVFCGYLRVFAAICASRGKNPEGQDSAEGCQLGQRDRDIAPYLCGGFSVPLESNGASSAVLVMQVVESPRSAKASGLDFAENPLWSGFVRFARKKKTRKFAIARIRSIFGQGSFGPPQASISTIQAPRNGTRSNE